MKGLFGGRTEGALRFFCFCFVHLFLGLLLKWEEPVRGWVCSVLLRFDLVEQVEEALKETTVRTEKGKERTPVRGLPPTEGSHTEELSTVFHVLSLFNWSPPHNSLNSSLYQPLCSRPCAGCWPWTGEDKVPGTVGLAF